MANFQKKPKTDNGNDHAIFKSHNLQDTNLNNSENIEQSTSSVQKSKESPEIKTAANENARENSSEDDTKSEKSTMIKTVDNSMEQSMTESTTNDEKHKKNNGLHVNNDVDILEKCDTCGQYLNNSDILYYQGHPQDAVEEFVALTNEKLVLASGKDFFVSL